MLWSETPADVTPRRVIVSPPRERGYPAGMDRVGITWSMQDIQPKFIHGVVAEVA